MSSEELNQDQRQPLTPAKQKRLEQCFDHASKQMAQSNYDYATELFAQCIVGDPSNMSYVQCYLDNLRKKYNNNKTGSKLAMLKERGARAGMKKAASAGVWKEVIRQGLKVLTVNPWDIPTLTAMATASQNMEDDEVEMVYLKAALESNPKDPDVNRQCAQALAARNQFDQAIACWHRLEQIRPDDEEAQRAIASLAVEKAFNKNKKSDADLARKMGTAGASTGDQEAALTPERNLQQEIDRNPQELTNYSELAQIYINKEKYQAAEDVMAKAFEASDGDQDVRERLEDIQLRNLRYQISLAEGEDAKESREQLRKQLHEKELEVYQNRCQRYPNNLAFKYDLGLRYQLTGNYNEAIKEFQQARNDPRRKGVCMLALGQCFQKIKQYRLASSHYDSAVEEIPDRDADNKKKALYQAGRLALAMKDLDMAEKHLSVLAGLDFTYKDVSALLDKVSKLREDD